MSRIDHAVRDLVYDLLLVREHEPVTPGLALERANNISAALVGNFRIEALPDDRPDPSLDDGRIT